MKVVINSRCGIFSLSGQQYRRKDGDDSDDDEEFDEGKGCSLYPPTGGIFCIIHNNTLSF